MRGTLDKDDSASWDREELQNYATAYNQATGKTLDVDALMEKYAGADGTIDYANQNKMLEDDALGFSVLKKLQSEQAAASSGTDSTSNSNEIITAYTAQKRKYAAFDAVRNFTYAYNGQLQPLLDKNNDGLWSEGELNNYAEAYNKATGRELDVAAILEKYGNGSGAIDPTNQALMKKDDALQLKNLAQAYATAVSTPEPTYNDAKTESSEKGETSYSLADLMGSMSPAGKAAYAMNINKYTSMGNMLGMFGMGVNNTYNPSNILDMNAMFSSLNTLQTARLAELDIDV
jgi:hypothetical protein